MEFGDGWRIGVGIRAEGGRGRPGRGEGGGGH